MAQDFYSRLAEMNGEAAKPSGGDFYSRLAAMQKQPDQSIDTGAQQSVSDPGAEAILGVSAEPPKGSFGEWWDKSLLDKAIDVSPFGLGRSIVQKTSEAVYGKPIEESWPAALEAGIDIPTGGLATAIPAVWGAGKGIAASPSQMIPGSSVLDKAGVVAKSAARGAVGESPLLSAFYERIGGEPIRRVSEGENISEVNRMATGSPLPDWAKTTLDIAGGTVGMIGAEKGIAQAGKAIGGAVERRFPGGLNEPATTPEETRQLTQAGELPSQTPRAVPYAETGAAEDARQTMRGAVADMESRPDPAAMVIKGDAGAPYLPDMSPSAEGVPQGFKNVVKKPMEAATKSVDELPFNRPIARGVPEAFQQGTDELRDPVLTILAEDGGIGRYKPGMDGKEYLKGEFAALKETYPSMMRGRMNLTQKAEQLNGRMGEGGVGVPPPPGGGTEWTELDIIEYLDDAGRRGGNKAAKSSQAEWEAYQRKVTKGGPRYEEVRPDRLDEGTVVTDLAGEQRTVHHTDNATELKDGDTLRFPYDRPKSEQTFYVKSGSVKPPATVAEGVDVPVEQPVPRTQILESPQKPTVTMEAAPAQKPIDAIDSVIESKPMQATEGVTVTKGSPIQLAHSGVTPQSILAETVAKSEAVEVVRTNGEKFRILDVLRSPSKIPVLKPVFDLAQTALNKATLLTRQKDGVRDIIGRYLNNDEKSVKAFAEAMWSGDAAQRRWTLPEFQNITKAFGLAPAQEVNVWKAYNIRRNFNDYLSREIGKSTGKMTAQDTDAVRVLQSNLDPKQKAHALAKLGLDMDEAEGILQSMPYREGHVPHVFRENMVYVKNPDGTDRVVNSFRTLKEAVDWADKSVANFPGLELSVRPKSVQWRGQAAKAAIVNDQRYANLLKRLENQYDMTVSEAREYLLNAGVKPKIQLSDRADFLAPAGKGRFFGHGQQRKGASGFRTDDIMEIFDSYDKGAIRYISTNPFKKNATSIFENTYGSTVDAAKGIEAKFVADYINDVNGVPGLTEQAINGLFKRVAPGLAERLPTSRPGIYVANKINHAVSVAKLGVWNPSSLFVNLSQNILTFSKTSPESFAKAIADTGKRTKEAKSIWRQLDIASQTGLSEAGEYTMSARAGDIVNGSMALFGWAEKRNREIAALAGYYDGLKSGLNHKQALDSARKLIRETQFEYNVIDTPFMFRGAAGRTLGQFKQYGSKYIETVAGMNPAQFVKWAVPTALMTGMAGIPFAKAANSILVSTMGDEYDIDTRVRQHIGDWLAKNPDDKVIQAAGKTMLYGAASNMVGVDVSQRVGQSDILPFFEKPEQLLGPAVSTAISTAKNVSGLSSGRTGYDDVIKGISPGAEGLYLTGKEIKKAVTGDTSPTVVRGQYGEDLYEPNTREKVARSAGFRPVIESELRQETRAKTVYRGIEETYKKAVLNSIMKKDPALNTYLKRWIDLRVSMGEDVTQDGLYDALGNMAETQNIDRRTRQIADEKNTPMMRLRVLNQMKQRAGQ